MSTIKFLVITHLIAAIFVMSGSAVAQTVPEELTDVILNAAVARLGEEFRDNIRISDMNVDDDWVFGIVIVRVADGEDAGPRLFPFLAHQEAGGWQMALENTSQFRSWLDVVPPQLLGEWAYAFWTNKLVTQGDGSSQLGFPFATGERLKFGGPHSDGSNAHAAIDFASEDSPYVRAARDGIVWRSAACPNYVQVNHSDGWSTGYYHLENESVINGQTVARGQILGQQGNGVGCGGSSSGAHVHFSLLYQGFPKSLHGHDIGGWTIEAGSRSYEGCLIRLSDGYRNCTGNGLINDGLIGSGNANATAFWIFNNSTLGWSVGNGLSFTAYDTAFTEGIPVWTVTNADPWLRSPVFAGTSAAQKPYVSLRLSSQNDACGQIYFRRSIDSGFDDTRKVEFAPISDGTLHSYLIDMRANANWNGNIIQLRIDPACQPNANPSTRAVRIGRVELTRLTPASQNLIVNPSFNNFDNWAFSNVWIWLWNGKFTVRRASDLSSWSAVYQDFNRSASAGSPFEITIRLGNDASTSRDVQVSLHDFDTMSDAITCTLTLPPYSPLRTYVARGHTTTNWRNLRFEFSVMTQSTTNDVVVDDISVQYRPGLEIITTECGQFPLTPSPNSPLDTVTINADQPTLMWTLVSGAASYDVQLDTITPPANTIFSITGNSYTITTLLPLGGPYYWRVRAVNASGSSAWSEIRSFMVVSPPGAAPARNYYITLPLTLTWNRVSWATGYEIQIDDIATFTSPIGGSVGADTLFYTVTSLADGTYYWRVRARKPDGTWSVWSAVDSFTIDAP